MANIKQCIKCRQHKETTQFSKCSARKDGLQWNCKSCNKEDNLKFRTEINPQHHAEWQRKNPEKLIEIVSKYQKADKSSIIYSIKNPDGLYYIGSTKKYLNVRKTVHIAHYKQWLKGKKNKLPLLHDSFDKWGIENHIFETIVDLGDYDRKQLEFVESTFIKSFKEIGKSLNIRN
jgi:hypothetical protein